MKFVRYDGDRLGLLNDSGIVDLTDRLGLTSRDPLREYIDGEYDASEYADESPDRAVEDVRVEAPVRRPGKIVAAPLNYRDHVEEMDLEMDIKERGYFLKAPSSVAGPDDGIELPFTDRRIDHEVELAYVLGDAAKDVSAESAWDSIFGYTILLDISVRGDQDRSNRKSYDTFTVIGPVVVTPDEVGDPQDLEMSLDLNGEQRQHTNTGEMIYDCADVMQYASIGTTLEPGDVITTGTTSGVSELADGDVIDAEIEGIGSMTVDVTARDVTFESVDVSQRS